MFITSPVQVENNNKKTERHTEPFKSCKNTRLVRITGLEPARLSPHEPESCASANSAISANLNDFYIITDIFQKIKSFFDFFNFYKLQYKIY